MRTLVILSSVAAVSGCAPRKGMMIYGRVVDLSGDPMPGCLVADRWRIDHLGAYHAEGFMLSPRVMRTDGDGKFVGILRHSPIMSSSLLAIDKESSQGAGVFICEKENGRHLLLQMQPLVDVHGVLEGSMPGELLYCMGTLSMAGSNYIVAIFGCDKATGVFRIKIPPGEYLLEWACADGARGRRECTVIANTGACDVGVIRLSEPEEMSGRTSSSPWQKSNSDVPAPTGGAENAVLGVPIRLSPRAARRPGWENPVSAARPPAR